mmetsp:Transcript_126705/g.253228  ORF Transcript_126705/g.253228 Transcript_126705/m.253228 type:complete len:110 (-) Transcript_126705:268-597(-)
MSLQKPHSLVVILRKSKNCALLQKPRKLLSNVWMCFAGFFGLHYRACLEQAAELSLRRSNNLGMNREKPQMLQKSMNFASSQRPTSLLPKLWMCFVGFFDLHHGASRGP